MSRIKLTQKEFIKRSMKILGNNYNFDKTIYIGSQENVIITCLTHGDFYDRASHILVGIGCPKCKLARHREDFIKKASLKHNHVYDYSSVEYVNGETKVYIKCPNGHIFDQTPHQHLRGIRCRFCFEYQPLTQEEFIRRVTNLYNGKYNLSKTIYHGTKKNVFIVCPEHGEFKTTAERIMYGQECVKCAKSYTTKEYIALAQSKWGNKFVYNLTEYINSQTYIKLQCAKGHLLKRNPVAHLCYGLDCRECLGIISQGEMYIKTFLTKHNIYFKEQYKFSKCIYKKALKFDFYLPDYNTCIEFDGIFHFKDIFNQPEQFKKAQKRDQIKTKFCESNGIQLLRINNLKITSSLLTNLIYPISI